MVSVLASFWQLPFCIVWTVV